MKTTLLLLIALILVSDLPIYAHGDLGQLIPITVNGLAKDKVDVVFIAAPHVPMDTVPQLSASFMEGLFTYEPFSQQKQKFNIYYIDKPVDENLFNCGLFSSNYYYCQNQRDMWLTYQAFNADILILLNHYSSYGSLVMHMQTTRGNNVFAHEFSHVFAKLDDEYVRYHSSNLGQPCNEQFEEARLQCLSDYVKRIEASVNTDGYGCPKWCSSIDEAALSAENNACSGYTTQAECSDAPISCVWFFEPHPFLKSHCVKHSSDLDVGLACQPGTGCYYGSDVGQLGFRSSPDSLMRNMMLPLNSISQAQVNRILACCYPRNNLDVCSQFHSNNRTWFNSTNSYSDWHRRMYSCGLDFEDINIDEKIDIFDYSRILTEFGAVGSYPPQNRKFSDIDWDYDVDIMDINRLINVVNIKQ